jgi:hypothetical protein
MKLVQLVFYGPTARRGSRWKVFVRGYPVRWYPRRYDLDVWEEMREVAQLYAREVLGISPQNASGPMAISDSIDGVVIW